MEVKSTPTLSEVPNRTTTFDWYSEGEERAVVVDGNLVVVRFVGRHGRKARISIQAPPGAEFHGPDKGHSSGGN